MSVTFIAVKTTGNDSSASNVLTIPAGLVANDMMLVSINVWNSGATLAITPPAGWTTLVSDNGGVDNHHYLFYKVHTGSEASTYTFTWMGASTNAACIVGYRGCKPTIGVFGTAESSVNTNTFNAPSVTAPSNGMLVTTFGIDDNQAGSASFTPPTGQTERADLSDPTVDINDIAICLNDVNVSAGVTGVSTSTSNHTGTWSAMALILEESSRKRLLASTGVGI